MPLLIAAIYDCRRFRCRRFDALSPLMSLSMPLFVYAYGYCYGVITGADYNIAYAITL